MHTQLLLAGFLLALVVGMTGLFVVERLPSMRERRQLHLFILAAPALLILTLAGDIAYMAWIGCLFRGNPLDILISAGFGLGLFGIALVSLVRHALRAWKVGVGFERLTTVQSKHAESLLSNLVGTAKPPRLWLVEYFQPMACTLGLFRPTIVLSTWVLDNLDEEELEGVLAHEWAHCLQRDNLIMTLAACLKDCTFYLFFIRQAFRSLLEEKELLADAWAASRTQKPAALASALYKFCTAPSPRLFSPAVDTAIQGFGHTLIEARIEALLSERRSQPATLRSWELVLAILFLVVLAALPAYWMPYLH